MRQKKNAVLSCAFLTLFLLLIALLHAVDVAPIGPEGTEIGLSRLNGAVRDLLPFRPGIYAVTEFLGILALCVCTAFAVLGFSQLLRRKSLLRVDRELFLLAGLYVLVLAVYVFFEKAVVNYRPFILPNEASPESSFPSSHTVLACVSFGSAFLLIPKYIGNARLSDALRALSASAMIVLVLGRLLSGTHWLTDILGGALLSAALLCAFSAALNFFMERTNKNPPGAREGD